MLSAVYGANAANQNASSTAHTRLQHACRALGYTYTQLTPIHARKFMLELITDINLTAPIQTPADPANLYPQMGRWPTKIRTVYDIGAYHGGSTCGLYQQRAFRIDDAISSRLSHRWEHRVIVLDNFLDMPPPTALHMYEGKPASYWRLLCNIEYAQKGNAWVPSDCAYSQLSKLMQPVILPPGQSVKQKLESIGSLPAAELVFVNPPRDAFDTFGELDYYWDSIVACGGSMVGYSLSDPAVNATVRAFAQRRNLRLDAWLIHAPGTKFERTWTWTPEKDASARVPPTFVPWSFRNKVC